MLSKSLINMTNFYATLDIAAKFFKNGTLFNNSKFLITCYKNIENAPNVDYNRIPRQNTHAHNSNFTVQIITMSPCTSTLQWKQRFLFIETRPRRFLNKYVMLLSPAIQQTTFQWVPFLQKLSKSLISISGGSWWNWPGGLRNFISGWTYGIVVLAVFYNVVAFPVTPAVLILSNS